MEKYLFTDGTSGVKEVQSREELQSLVQQSADPGRVRVWIFDTNEWINYSSFCKQYPFSPPKETKTEIVVPRTAVQRQQAGKRWLKKFLFVAALVAGALLVFNFTSIKWEKTTPLSVTAQRPANAPLMDMDSLVATIEYTRGKPLDRSTRNNLRLRNTWPERILLQLNAERETSKVGTRHFHVDISIDNTTGLDLDSAIVKLLVWKRDKISRTDTLQFRDIRYDRQLVRRLNDIYRGDSLSLSFQSIRARAFNFCYTADVENNSGNYNDRWFCLGE